MALAVQTTNTGSDTTGTSHTVNLPASIAANDILLLVWQAMATGFNPGTPTGFTSIFSGSTINPDTRVYYKVAAGGETSVTVSTNANVESCYYVYRISGGDTSSAPQVSQTENGNANPDPPNIAPGWGSQNILWFAVGSFSNSATTISAYPTNYTTNGVRVTNASGGFGGSGGFGISYRTTLASSEDPGAFTLSSSSNGFRGLTIAVRPTSVSFSVSDTVTATDTISFRRAALFTIIDTITQTEIISAVKAKVFSVLDTITGSDTVSFLFKWTRQSRNTTTFTNATKHSTAWTDQNGHSTSWTDQTRN